MTGRNAGKWPDWRDLTKNRVLANIWYTSPQVGILLLKWLGRIREPETTVVKAGGGEIRVTADGDVTEASYRDGQLVLKLKPAPQPKCRVAIAGVSPFDKVRMISPRRTEVSDISYHEKYGVGFVRFEPNDAPVVTLKAQVELRKP